MSARRGEGVADLLKNIEEIALGLYETKPKRLTRLDPSVENAVQTLVGQIETTYPGLPNPRWVALRLLESDESIIRAIREGTLGELSQAKAPIPNRLIPLEAT
jgi:ferrous iron transport protein B